MTVTTQEQQLDRPSDAPEVAVPDILVVDDDPANQLAIQAAIGDLGTRLVMASSGEEALRRLLEADFALILLDVHMPTMDGFETARLIRKRKRNRYVPIVFVTAYDQSDARVTEGYELGAVDFLFKPIVTPVLRSKATVFIELARRTAEVSRQAEQLRTLERNQAIQRLEQERRQWEEEALRRQMEEQRRVAQEMARKARELADTVAEREAAQAELTRINARLAEADRRKDEFLATLAHELRNPLAPMSYALGLLEHIEDPQLREVRDRMERQLAHLERLVDDLLDVSRVTSGKIELRRAPLDMRDAVMQAVELSRTSIQDRQQKLHLDLPSDAIPVVADGVRMAQVVSNLLNNAARYTPDGGDVWVRAWRSRDEAVVTVRDNGRGIQRAMLERIFEAFVQEKIGGGGLGLGLHLVQRLVQLHQGKVRAFSEGPGKGSTFEIRVPLAPEAALPVREGERPSMPPTDAERPLRIVVVEDQEDIREMVTLLLERWGHRVQTAADGQDGIDLIVREKPDIALVDIGLPDMDGYEVAQHVRKALQESCPPLVAVTGWGQPQDRERALAAGFSRHLVKPVSPRELKQALAQA